MASSSGIVGRVLDIKINEGFEREREIRYRQVREELRSRGMTIEDVVALATRRRSPGPIPRN